jgi:large subunit ribosomal protein L20
LALVKAGQHAYVDRKLKKRTMRSLWIERLSAACQMRGTKYSLFINAMTTKRVMLNRKVLSNIAVAFPQVFDEIHTFVTK